MAKISSGDYNIISTGTVISFQDKPVVILFGHNDSLTLKFSFHTDDKDRRLEGAPDNVNKVLELKLFNFKSSLAEGPIQPVRIGDEDEKDLFVNFRVEKLTEGESRTLHYTIYKHV